jgi:hypothetical protein
VQLCTKLVDPKNNPAKADKNLPIKLKGRTPSGTVETIDVVIKASEDSQIAGLPLHESGPFTVNASNDELVTGGIIFNVRSAGSQLSTPF